MNKLKMIVLDEKDIQKLRFIAGNCGIPVPESEDGSYFENRTTDPHHNPFGNPGVEIKIDHWLVKMLCHLALRVHNLENQLHVKHTDAVMACGRVESEG